ncbi:MAG: tRNA 2-thiouridine(34) synthase MnmA [Deltaproteobacteria bacterium]
MSASGEPVVRPSGRVVAALSGGVDSSVAAAVVVEQGREVVGLTLRLHGEPDPDSGPRRRSSCCAPKDIADARAIARQLSIPFYVLDAEERFERHVVRPFVDAYLEGETPLPCADCNRELKFGHLWRRARALGARLCTGHYARVAQGADGRFRLLRARDLRRDQSYFLYGLSQEVLAGLELPLGELTKDEVRSAARERGLRVAEKPDSQELCFAPADYATFVERRASGPLPTGSFVTQEGRTLGEHAGIHRFTVGQRKGLPIVDGRPTYVKALDAARSEVVVAFEHELARGDLEVDRVSYPAGEPSGPFEALVRVRHQHQGEVAIVTPLGGRRAHVRFRHPVRAPAPGQAAVFYQDDETVGGGTILPA